jgi:hypothetical protein
MRLNSPSIGSGVIVHRIFRDRGWVFSQSTVKAPHTAYFTSKFPSNFPINHPPKFPIEFTRSFTFRSPDRSLLIHRSFTIYPSFSCHRISRFPFAQSPVFLRPQNCRHRVESITTANGPPNFAILKIAYLRPLASWRLSDINVLCNVPLHHLLRLPKGATPLENPPI